ncbi:MAG: tetratricopeptide repeat protein [Aetokthonos hydrillicola CCALA 1050]|nr:tetratricopeptide repeat protein [Aetokthonos hydrillicola CCALA 1050]MBW4590069.1 tetratricopeptide repeat protein [Aetokthonos hydrillicola CCALA 1050]
MTISGEHYVVARRRRFERRQKLVSIVSIISFLGSTIFAVVPALKEALQGSKPPVTALATSSLQQQVRGLEMVLQREPENRVALENLVRARIRLKNLQAAIPPLEKLVKLDPQRKDYKQMLGEVKQQLSNDKTNDSLRVIEPKTPNKK